MKFMPLVWAALWRNRTESVLTLLALSVAFALFGTMIALNAAYEQAINTRMAFVIGAIMAFGALFGAVKIMYAAVRARTREIGILRTIGFGATAVALSVLLAAALLGAIGALIGTAITWLLLDGREVWVWGAFKLRVSPSLWMLGLAWALVTSLLGGLFPALRAGRLPPFEALRAE